MNRPTLEPIEYQGELVALVAPTRIRIIATSLRDRPADDYDRRFVVFMCLRCRDMGGACDASAGGSRAVTASAG